MSRYTFGDDQSAIERLRLVADAYETVSRAFLATEAPQPAGLAIDLGCGPAFSTGLLLETCCPTALIGIDSSPEFIRFARRRLPGVRFETHDVTATHLPGAPADLMYSRLLLSHLPDPEAIIQRWISQLVTGGILLLEDLEESINPPGPLLEYEDVSTEIVRSGGGTMYAGAVLGRMGGDAHPVTVPAALAAEIYLFNVQRWRSEPNLSVSNDRLTELEDGLVRTREDDHATTVTWVVRHLSVRG